MIDKTLSEQKALEAALIPLGEIADEIGFSKPFVHYTRDEALKLIEVVVTAYQTQFLENVYLKKLQENLEIPYLLEGVPFDVSCA